MKPCVVLLMLLAACAKPGDVDGMCLESGLCNSTALECRQEGDRSYCRPRQPARNCLYESQCFCVTCAEKCGAAGVAECLYSDTTTWGARQPAVCRCK